MSQALQGDPADAADEASSIRTVGHATRCSTPRGAGARPGLPPAEVDYHVAGINHVAFFLNLEHDGEDLYPRVREVTPRLRTTACATSCCGTFGYFVRESSEHFAEYSPWFIRTGREDLIERFNVPFDEYPRRCDAPIAAWESRRAELEGGGAIGTGRGDAYGADIIRACETGQPFSFNGNVPNRCGDALLIDNLPADCCVEVPCVA